MNFHRAFFATGFLAGCFLFGLMADLDFAVGDNPVAQPDVRKLVQSVDMANKSIAILAMRTNMSHTYRLDELSTILIDGSPAKFSDIKAGMEVSDSTERDYDTLDNVSLMSKTSAPVAVDPSKPAAPGGPDKTIQSVLAAKNAVVIFFAKSKIQRTYHIDGSTALKVNGVPGAFGDIKPGMEVKDYLERDNDYLDSLTVIGY